MVLDGGWVYDIFCGLCHQSYFSVGESDLNLSPCLWCS
jgi:hypothetical protein